LSQALSAYGDMSQVSAMERRHVKLLAMETHKDGASYLCHSWEGLEWVIKFFAK